MKIVLLLFFAAGLVALVRWFHPATFALPVLSLLIILGVLRAAFVMWRMK